MILFKDYEPISRCDICVLGWLAWLASAESPESEEPFIEHGDCTTSRGVKDEGISLLLVLSNLNHFSKVMIPNVFKQREGAFGVSLVVD